MGAVSKLLPRYKAKTFEEAPSWVLVALGASCFLVAGCFTLMFAAVLPDLIKATNGREISLSQATALWAFLAPGHTAGRRAALRFAAVWIVLTAINTTGVASVAALADLRSAQVLKPALDLLTAGLGFLLSRHWVYRR